MYRIGIDLGGTNIKIAVVDDNFNIIKKLESPTKADSSPDAILDDIANLVRKTIDAAGLTMDDISSVGFGIPGAIDSLNGIVLASCNLNFSNTPVAKMLSERLQKEVFIENDANVAAYGEYIICSDKPNIFIAITLGTGVGGGILIDGNIFTGSNYVGGELGHICININGELCKCGNYGCWETYASATALIRQTRAAMKRYPKSIMWKLCDADLNKVDGKTAFEAMRLGDSAAELVVNTYCEYVAIGISNIINIFQPNILCIGGGVSKEGEEFLKRIDCIVSGYDHASSMEKHTKLKIAELGNDAGIIGAAFIGDSQKKIEKN